MNSDQPAPPRQTLWQVIGLCLSGSLFYCFAFAPWGTPWLAFLAPVPWVWIVLDGRRLSTMGWGGCWCVGILMWIGLPCVVGWPDPLQLVAGLPVALSLGAILPIFLSLSRVLSRTPTLPVWFVCPLVWMALEFARGWLTSGLALGQLAHAVVGMEWLVQLSSLGGSLLVSGLIVAIAACAAQIGWGARHYLSVVRLMHQFDDVSEVETYTVLNFSSREKPVIDFRNPPELATAKPRPTPERVAMRKTIARVQSRARHDDVYAPLFAAIMLTLLIGLTYVNGRQRIREMSQWKMFEANRFRVVGLAGASDVARVTANSRSTTEGPEDVWITIGSPRAWRIGDETFHPLSVISLQELQSQQADGPWIVSVGAIEENAFTTSLEGGFQHQQIELISSSKIAVSGPATRLRLVVAQSDLGAIEVHQAMLLRSLPAAGVHIDAVVYFVEGAPWGNNLWDDLIARAAFAAATANRCSLLLMMPDGRSTLVSRGAERSYSRLAHGLNTVSTGAALVDPRASGLQGWGIAVGPVALVAVLLGLVTRAVVGCYTAFFASRRPVPPTPPVRTLRGSDLARRPQRREINASGG